MRQKIEIATFLAICIMIVSFAIKAGKHHENCRQCKLSTGIIENKSAKFAEVCK